MNTKNNNSQEQVLAKVDGQINANKQFAVATVAATESKMSKARAIYAHELEKVGGDHNKVIRKDLIALFKSEAECTQAGAATYWQQIRDKAGMVNHRTA